MHQVVVISYRHFGTTYQSQPQGSRIQNPKPLDFLTVKMGPIGWYEMSVRNYQ